MKTNLSEELS